ncbi:MAG: ATP-dependent DNA helicase [Lachnospiraceae bacterium]|nr:ATP-dependent DNA helicase [Lachnospiraceae bacterium]
MKITDEKTVRLSVRELVEFVLKRGDIDNRRTGPAIQDAMLTGGLAHRTFQASAGADYAQEVPLGCVRIFEDDIRLDIDGRADGIITDSDGENTVPGTICIDEIKGVFRNIMSMEEADPVHLAQAEMYAYMLAADRLLPEVHVRITYIQLDLDEKTQQPIVLMDQIRHFVYHYSFSEIEEKYLFYTGLYEKWARFIVEHREARRESADGFPFPYEFRPGQKKIISQVYKSIEGKKRLFVQAPTGIGKTLAMLFPSVRAVGAGFADKIFYLTGKTVTSNAAEEGMKIMGSRGLGFSYVKITAKEKMCPLEKMQCDPVHCERAKGHLDRVNEAVYDLITHEGYASSEIIASYAMKHQVCPYEMSLDVSYYMDVIIGDYNYAFSPHVMLQRYFASGEKRDYIFLIDEAHNLPDRARDMYSAELVKEDVLQAKKLFEGQKRILKLLDKVNKQLLALKRECREVTVFSKEDFPNVLLFDLLSLREAIARYMDRHPEIPGHEQMLDFYFEIADFLSVSDHLENKGYMAYASFKDNGSFFIRLFCIDPSERLRKHLDNVVSTVFFSATFLPINYYKDLLTGDREDMAMYVDSPFDPAKRKLLIARDVSSVYRRRNAEEYRKIADYLQTMVRGSRGNYLAFFPSHKFMEDVKEALDEMCLQQAEPFDMIMQKRVMKEDERQAFLKEFEQERDRSLLALSVMGGLFSEGIDLKNDLLIGVAVVGTGLPQVCTERDLIRQYYNEHEVNGFDYAYRYPGFNKVMQAAGRLIRTADDVGVILLLDERFAYRESLRLFPKEWADFQVTDSESAAAQIERFWRYI